MRKTHTRNTIRYYILLFFLLIFFFFSNDFGLTDVQKTAIVMAVGIDREADSFLLTSQIAIPQSSKQGKSSETVQIVSRGKTIGEAFEEVNAKTGWYPKLVFCNLILLGESAATENTFDALDYFLRDEYLSDNCFVATCNGLAKEILDVSALVDSSSSTAIQKVLSKHAERVGTVLPNTLKNFSIGYFSESRSGFLPIVKKEPQQVRVESPSSEESSQSGKSESAKQQEEKPVFSAGETALFVNGKRVDVLTTSETFALSSVLNELQLASYSVERESGTCALVVKQNSPKTQLVTGIQDTLSLKIDLTMTAGVLDFSKSQDLSMLGDSGDVPKEYFTLAERKLAGEIQTVYEKCRAVNCDLFGVRERLIKYKKRSLKKYANEAFKNTKAEVSVHFRGVR